MTARTTTIRFAAVLGILALGVGAGLAGSRLAVPAESAVTPPASATETIPVIAPVARGEEPLPEDSDGDENTFDVSPAIARTQVPVGDMSPELAAAVDALGSLNDPATGFGLTVLGDDGDPCADEGAGEEAGDCPDGIRGAIFGLTGAAFAVYPVVNPAVTAINDYTVHCPATGPGADDAGRVRLGVGTSAPAASMTVSYHPVGMPDAAREFTASTTPAARDTWETAPLAAPGSPPLAQHCFTLDGLDPSLRYELTVSAEDDSGGSGSATRYFGLEHDLTRPPARVVPLLQNVVFTSVPHKTGQSVSVKALPLDDGGPAECGAEDGLLSLYPLGEAGTGTVSLEYLERNGFLPEYSRRTGQAFFLAEGSSILLCLFVYDDDRPSWSWDTAEYRYSVVVQAPDVTVPTVTLTDIDLHPSFRSDGHVSIRSQERGGRACGGRSFTLSTVEELYFASGDFEELICGQDHLSGGASVRSGDVILQALIGEARNAVLLPLSSIACSGICELPESATYQLLLPTVDVPDGLCGSSFGDCDPPTSAMAAGTATFRVDWVQGQQNGQEDWAIGELVESSPETPTADRPRLNTRAALEEVNDVSGFHLAFDLEVDRPVGFSAVLSGDCILPDTVTEVTGEFESGTQRVQFDNVCHASQYTVSVLLFDGETVTPYGLGVPDGYWRGGQIRTTPIEKRLNTSFSIADRDAVHDTSLILPLEVTVNSRRLDLEIMSWGRCVYGSSLGAAGLIDTVEMSELVTVTVTAGIRNGNGEPLSDAHPRCTDAEPDTGERMTFRVVVPLASITHSGLTITAPDDSPYAFSITLRDWP